MRIREGDLKVPTLRLLAGAPSGFMKTADLISALDTYFQPSGTDADLLTGRSDTYFSQKVRNLVSHRGTSTGLEARGLATYVPAKEGWQIETPGRTFVDTADAD